MNKKIKIASIKNKSIIYTEKQRWNNKLVYWRNNLRGFNWIDRPKWFNE